METSPQSNGVSPRPTDVKPAQAQRIAKQFRGCSRIADYEILGKLGEGTFGYVWPPTMIYPANRMVLQ
jgi:serine/threonine-protein kinase BUR1